MPLTPLDIHNKEFRRAFRGYSEDEVDDFLDEVVKEFETLLKENGELKEGLQKATEQLQHFRNMEEAVSNTLLAAQTAAEELKGNAKKEAELITRQAEMEREKIVKEAYAEARRIAQEYEQLEKKLMLVRTRLKSMLQAQIELLESTTKEAEEEMGTPDA